MNVHTHECQRCGVETPCEGTLERNEDGAPEVICGVFHLPMGRINERFLCEACQEAQGAHGV